MASRRRPGRSVETSSVSEKVSSAALMYPLLPRIGIKEYGLENVIPKSKPRKHRKTSTPLKETMMEYNTQCNSLYPRIARSQDQDPVFARARLNMNCAQKSISDILLQLKESKQEAEQPNFTFETPQKRGRFEFLEGNSTKRRRMAADDSYIEETDMTNCEDQVIGMDYILRMVDNSFMDTPEKCGTPRIVSTAPAPSPNIRGAQYAYNEQGEDQLVQKWQLPRLSY